MENEKSVFLIMEGLDNVGKTSQIKALHKYFLNDKIFQTLHYSGIPEISLEECVNYSTSLYTDMFEMMMDSRGKRNFIFDRAHLGELVYGPMYRNYTGDYVLDIEKQYSEVLKDELHMVVLYDDPENLLKRDDGLSISNRLEDITKEVDLFKQAFCKSAIHNKMLLNTHNLTIPQVTEKIINFLR